MRELLIIGKTPPPIGGVTIHNKRLADVLQKLNGNFMVVSPRYFFKKSIRMKKKLTPCRHVHLSVSNTYFIFLVLVVLKLIKKKNSVTIHGNVGRFNFVRSSVERLNIYLADYVFVLNDNSYKIASCYNTQVQQISAYLKPSKDELNDRLVSTYFESQIEEEKIIVTTNAFNVNITSSGNEVYSILPLIRLFNKYPDFEFIISDPTGNYHRYVVNEKKIPVNNNIHFIDEPHSYCAVLNKCDLFIRATRTDGDSLSIREALDLDVTVLASDVVSRPQGCYLFSINNFKEVEEFITAFSKSPKFKQKGSNQPEENKLTEFLANI